MIDWDDLDRRLASREATVVRLLAAGPRALVIPGECGGPITLMIHRDTYPGRVGKWRLTRADGDGPFGHTEAETWEGAVREAKHWGARYEEAREP